MERKLNHYINGLHYGLAAYINDDGTKCYYLDWATSRGKAKGQYSGGDIATTEAEIKKFILKDKEIRKKRFGRDYDAEREETSKEFAKLIKKLNLDDLKYNVLFEFTAYQEPLKKSKAFATLARANNFIKKLENNKDYYKFIELVKV
jgi:hypothetical protein